MEILSQNLSDTKAEAQKFLDLLKSKFGSDSESRAIVVGLSGDLGSGKTTFSQACAEILGVTEVVTSPTFIIEKIYTTKNAVFERFIHIDAYRLDDAKELEALGFDDLLKKPKTLIFIEWPEKVQEILPKNTPIIYFKFIDENTRSISYNI